MGYIVDIVVLAIIAIAIIRGLKDGFIKSIMRLVSFVVAVVVAWSLNGVVSQFLYEKVFHSSVTSAVTAAIDGITEKTGLDALISGGSEEITKIVEKYGINKEDAKEAYDEIEKSGSSSNFTEQFASKIAEKAAWAISRFVAFVGVFIVAFILLKILTIALNALFSNRILSGLNKWGGFAFGLLTGVLWGVLIIWAVRAIEPTLCSMYPEVFTKSFSDTSLIIRGYDWVKGLIIKK